MSSTLDLSSLLASIGTTPGAVVGAVVGAVTSTWFGRQRDISGMSAMFLFGLAMQLLMSVSVGVSGAAITQATIESLRTVSPFATSYLCSALSQRLMQAAGDVLDREHIGSIVGALTDRIRGGSKP